MPPRPRELKSFEESYIASGQYPPQIAIAPRRFDAMADVECMMWLQLGVELEMFDAQSAEKTFKEHKKEWLASLNYVERTKISKLFRGEAEVFSSQVRLRGIPLAEHPRRLSASLFTDGPTEMLFHEVGRRFRDGVLTLCLVFATQNEFRRELSGKPDPDVLLRGRNLRGTNLILNKYLGFLEHAGSLQQLWEYFGWTSESRQAISTLQERVRSMHGWRLDLLSTQVKERFDEVTGFLVEGVKTDKQLQVLGLGAPELLSQIRALCSSWTGEDGLPLARTTGGGEGGEGTGGGQIPGKPTGGRKPPVSTPVVQVSVINESTVLTDADVAPVVVALQKQVSNDFCPVWGAGAELIIIPKGTHPPSGSWWLVLLDDADQANALGYHDLTTEGLPIGKVFVVSDMKAGTSWTVTASHELLEILGDPSVNLTVFVQNSDTPGTLYAYEVCDACQDDSFGYQIDNVLVSDFVYPSWFESFRAEGSTQFDRMNRIQNPLQLLAGGYIGIFDINSGFGWQQQTADKHPTNVLHRGAVGTRRERRSTPRDQWVDSLPQRKIFGNAQLYRQQLENRTLPRRLMAG